MAGKKASILWVDDEIDLLKSQIMFLEDRATRSRRYPTERMQSGWSRKRASTWCSWTR